MLELQVNYEPQVKKYEQGYKISDIEKQAKKDDLISLHEVANEADKAFNEDADVPDGFGYQFDLDDILEAIDQKGIVEYKPFNTDEAWQWFIKKWDLHKVLDYLGC